jgi:sphinganine-1-phosphate aldolase
MTHQFIADLKDAVEEARNKPAGKGTMVSIYGTFDKFYKRRVAHKITLCPGLGTSNAAGSTLVSKIASIFLDTLYVA